MASERGSHRRILPLGEWRKRAACLGKNPDIWYPAKKDDPRQTEAKKTCLGCPVRQECLDWALENGEKFGIWGGKSENERRVIRRRWLRERGLVRLDQVRHGTPFQRFHQSCDCSVCVSWEATMLQRRRASNRVNAAEWRAVQ